MQSKSVYLYSRKKKAGKRVVAMGLMEMLKTRVADVAYFKPVIKESIESDEDIGFFKGYFPLKQPEDSAYGITADQLAEYIAKDQLHTAYELILERFSKLEGTYDFILCDGVGSVTGEIGVPGDIDLEIARNLSTPLLWVASAKGYSSVSQLREMVEVHLRYLQKNGTGLLAIVMSRVQPDLLENVKKEIDVGVPLFSLPEVAELDRPTMYEIAEATGAKLLSSDRQMLDRVILQSKVAAMMTEHYLHYLQEGDLIIVPGDRSDIATATFLANISKNFNQKGP